MEPAGRRNAGARVEQVRVGSSEQASHKAKARNLRDGYRRRCDGDPAGCAPFSPASIALRIGSRVV
jgi:hypothetical protein